MHLKTNLNTMFLMESKTNGKTFLDKALQKVRVDHCGTTKQNLYILYHLKEPICLSSMNALKALRILRHTDTEWNDGPKITVLHHKCMHQMPRSRQKRRVVVFCQ